MSQVIHTYEPPMIVLLQTPFKDRKYSALLSEINCMWERERRGDADYIRWRDDYEPARFSLRYPAIAQYIVDNNLPGDVAIFNYYS